MGIGIDNVSFKAIRRAGEPVSLTPTNANSFNTKGIYSEWLNEGEDTDVPMKQLTLARPDAEGIEVNTSEVSLRGSRYVVGAISYSRHTALLTLREHDDAYTQQTA